MELLLCSVTVTLVSFMYKENVLMLGDKLARCGKRAPGDKGLNNMWIPVKWSEM